MWDETKGLCGEIGRFAAVARRSGDAWHVGAITDWAAREIEIDTSFLGDGEWEVTAFADADDADRFPGRWTRTVRTVRAGERIKVRMAPGGGWTAVAKRAGKK